MEEAVLADYPILQVISYILTVLVGGVGYKFLTVWLGHREKQEDRTDEQNQKLIDNLQNRVDNLTERLIQLETQKDEAHDRELKLTIQLTEAKAEVKILSNKVQDLERNQQIYKDLVEHYKERLEKYEKE